MSDTLKLIYKYKKIRNSTFFSQFSFTLIFLYLFLKKLKNERFYSDEVYQIILLFQMNNSNELDFFQKSTIL